MEKILVISTFPPKGSLYGNKFSAVASYTKNTLTHIVGDIEFIVLADILSVSEKYAEQNIEVVRCWRRNNIKGFFAILKNVLGHKDAKRLIFAFEFGMFGSSKLLLGLIPILLLFVKLLGKKIHLVSHGVILDFSSVSEQMGVSRVGLLSKIVGVLLKIYYYILSLLSTKIVVFEEYLRQSLIGIGVSKDKIYTIPHGVHEEEKIPSKEESRKRLGIDSNAFVILCFGFLIWYKGSDFIVGAFKDNFEGKNIKLIMAGGESSIHKKDPAYSRYISNLYEGAKECSNIQITGFLREEEIKFYFTACDLVVLPYRAFISASGPLSFALTYEKPFLLSKVLKGYSLNNDFQDSLVKNNLSIEDLVFDMENRAFFEKIVSLSENKSKLRILERFSKDLYERRKWSCVGKLYSELF